MLPKDFYGGISKCDSGALFTYSPQTSVNTCKITVHVEIKNSFILQGLWTKLREIMLKLQRGLL